jgi:BirA family transcriptional regulator, biotin operon repressor / biotin---[acetyl-CoA-carboxylase] ligase
VNDVLIDGRKVAGVLVATVTQADALEAVVVGVGANVERRPDVVPTPFAPSVACLRDFPGGAALTHDGFLAAILEQLGARAREVCARGPGILFPAYRELSIVRGRAARILSEEGVEIAAGIVEDIRPDLRLVFRGRKEPVDRGRLALI